MIVKSVLSLSERLTNRDLLKEKGTLCKCRLRKHFSVKAQNDWSFYYCVLLHEISVWELELDSFKWVYCRKIIMAATWTLMIGIISHEAPESNMSVEASDLFLSTLSLFIESESIPIDPPIDGLSEACKSGLSSAKGNFVMIWKIRIPTWFSSLFWIAEVVDQTFDFCAPLPLTSLLNEKK